jgi:hypothetical protein
MDVRKAVHDREIGRLHELESALRHVSFLQTGRAQPSREMVLRSGAALAVPLRDQNVLLDAAGLRQAFEEPALVDGIPEPVRMAIDRMAAQQEPFPLGGHEPCSRRPRRQPRGAAAGHPLRGRTAERHVERLPVATAPQNVTLEELRVESCFPLDEATIRACERLARD